MRHRGRQSVGHGRHGHGGGDRRCDGRGQHVARRHELEGRDLLVELRRDLRLVLLPCRQAGQMRIVDNLVQPGEAVRQELELLHDTLYMLLPELPALLRLDRAGGLSVAYALDVEVVVGLRAPVRHQVVGGRGCLLGRLGECRLLDSQFGFVDGLLLRELVVVAHRRHNGPELDDLGLLGRPLRGRGAGVRTPKQVPNDDLQGLRLERGRHEVLGHAVDDRVQNRAQEGDAQHQVLGERHLRG